RSTPPAASWQVSARAGYAPARPPRTPTPRSGAWAHLSRGTLLGGSGRGRARTRPYPQPAYLAIRAASFAAFTASAAFLRVSYSAARRVFLLPTWITLTPTW